MTIKRTHGISLGAQRLALPAAGEKQARKLETVIAQNKLQKRAESQPSGARFVGRIYMLLRSLTSTNYN